MKILSQSKQYLTGLIMILGLINVSLTYAATSPEALIEAESQKLLGILEKEGASFANNPQALYTAVGNQLKRLADIRSIAKGIMGSYYKQATAEQQNRFAKIFETSLIKIYSDALMKKKPKSLTLIPAKKAPTNPRKRRVSVKIATKDGSVYQVGYSMLLDKQDKWQVRNIVVDGVNFGLTYRNQFKSEMQKNGNMDTVINNWSQTIKK